MPHSTTVVPPAELLLRRSLKLYLDLLHSQVQERVPGETSKVNSNNLLDVTSSRSIIQFMFTIILEVWNSLAAWDDKRASMKGPFSFWVKLID